MKNLGQLKFLKAGEYMKAVKVAYTTKKGDFFDDIYFTGRDIFIYTEVCNQPLLVERIYNILKARYGEIYYWSIVKWYEE